MDSLTTSLILFGLGLMTVMAMRLIDPYWWKPRRLERMLRAQGINGNSYRFLYGDAKLSMQLSKEAESRPMALSHDIIPRVSPFIHQAIAQHGNKLFVWNGPVPAITIMDPELVKEVLANKLGQFDRRELSSMEKLLITGLVSLRGDKWAKHRRIINPAFHLDKLKRMLPAFSTCCDELIDRWEKLVDPEGSHEIDVWAEFQNLTGDVISRMAFGSSFEQGRRVFELQMEFGDLFVKDIPKFFIPGYRFLPTKNNRRMKAISGEVDALLRKMIEQREEVIRKGEAKNDDLLGLLLDSNLKGNESSNPMTTEDVIGECKLFYFAGHETTAILLTWTLVVLSMHPTWQVRAREEVLQVLGQNKPPDYNSLN